ncbi:hypothetical protein [Acidiferrobacter sp.]|uniref:hypothetical protein n=1 Tax=Acidiferrobacter sp. TaxID=1872107 RepID=UPI00260D3E7A|nr:hypothetical protein [Acidiferrobacter sp.]
MGHTVDFVCRACRYEERDLAVGHGRQPEPCLRLFHCDNCHSVGSTWLGAGRIARCSFCYHEAITLLADDAAGTPCPKCHAPGTFVHRRDQSWE